MKKILGLAIIILVSGILIQVAAQGNKPGAVKKSDGSEAAPVTEQADQEQVAQPKPVSKPASEPAAAPGATTVSKPEPAVKPAPSAETAPVSKPEPFSKPGSTGTTAPAPAPKPKTGTVGTTPAPSTPAQTTQPVKGPSRDKRMHAEEKSKGHAFSGKGKGGDKNLVDPAEKDKDVKTKKAKKAKKAKNTKKVK